MVAHRFLRSVSDVNTGLPRETRMPLETSIQDSSLRQACAAIELFHEGKLDCAITLAAAAEGMLPDTDDPHLRQIFDQALWRELDPNLVINWLKHGGEFETATIAEFEAVFAVGRAITKFVAVYHQSCAPFEGFLRFAHAQGHLPKLYRD